MVQENDANVVQMTYELLKRMDTRLVRVENRLEAIEDQLIAIRSELISNTKHINHVYAEIARIDTRLDIRD